MRTPEAAFMQYLADQWARHEACRGPLIGCLPSEIDEIQNRQGVSRLPEVYVEFMLAMGREMGGLEEYVGSEMRYPYVLNFKEQTFGPLQKPTIFVMACTAKNNYAFYFYPDKDDPFINALKYYDFMPTGYEFRVGCGGRLSDWLVELVADATPREYEE